MRTLCIGATGNKLPAAVLCMTGNFGTSTFDLVVGNEYEVFSICLWGSGAVHYLVLGTATMRPEWVPADLFRVIDDTLPSSWVFAYHGYTLSGEAERILAMWGYEEMVRDLEHYDKLQEREPSAMITFDLARRRMPPSVSGRCSLSDERG